MYALGCAYRWTPGAVDTNESEAVRWWTQAANSGHADAACNLGTAYALGIGVARNVKSADYWWTRSAELGNVLARSHLARHRVLYDPDIPYL